MKFRICTGGVTADGCSVYVKIQRRRQVFGEYLARRDGGKGEKGSGWRVGGSGEGEATTRAQEGCLGGYGNGGGKGWQNTTKKIIGTLHFLFGLGAEEVDHCWVSETSLVR